MTQNFKFANFFTGELLDDMSIGDTVLHVTPELSAKLEAFDIGDSAVAALALWDGVHDPEIVYCTENPQTGWMTVLRAQEGTTAFPWAAGTQVRLIVSAGILNDALAAYFDYLVVLDANFLKLTGGTLTGALQLAADPTADLGAATKRYVDNIQGNKLPVTGGTMQGSINMNNNRILALSVPNSNEEPVRLVEFEEANLDQSKINADRSGSLPTAGTASAYTISSNHEYSTLSTGLTIRARVHTTNEDSATLALDSTAPKPIQIIPGELITPGRLIVGVPYDFVYSAPFDAWLVVGQLAEFSTGDTKLSFDNTPLPGWIVADDGSIGSATSGATRAGNAYRALYLKCWAKLSNTYAPVAGGRGATAAADWAANKAMTIPKTLSRVLGVAGAGSGLSSRANGQTVGAETHVLTIAELATHHHVAGIYDPTHVHQYTRHDPGFSYSYGTWVGQPFGASSTQNTTASATGVRVNSPNGLDTTHSTGSGGAHNNMQPTTFLHLHIKL